MRFLPPTKNHPSVTAYYRECLKSRQANAELTVGMTEDEYQFLFHIAREFNEKYHVENILEIGCGSGVSTAILAMALPAAIITTVDTNPAEKTMELVPEDFQLNIVPKCMQSDQLYGSNRFYDIILVDANHTEAGARADLEWAVKHGKIIIAHDINHPGTEHIGRICEELSKGFSYTTLNSGHGLGIISLL